MENAAAAQKGQAGGASEGLRVCRKCLLREMREGEYFKNMYDYIAHLDSDVKADDVLYEKRLAACKSCEHLMNGMCRICGCFVEMRAAVRKNYCPAPEHFWKAV